MKKLLNSKTDLNDPLLKRCLDFLNEHKKYVGISDWKIIITKRKILDTENAYAEADGGDYLNKIFKVTLSEELLKKDEKFIADVLFHELIHGRLHIFQSKMNADNYREEEEMINDLVRGFTIFKGEFKLQDGKKIKTKN